MFSYKTYSRFVSWKYGCTCSNHHSQYRDIKKKEKRNFEFLLLFRKRNINLHHDNSYFPTIFSNNFSTPINLLTNFLFTKMDSSDHDLLYIRADERFSTTKRKLALPSILRGSRNLIRCILSTWNFDGPQADPLNDEEKNSFRPGHHRSPPPFALFNFARAICRVDTA